MSFANKPDIASTFKVVSSLKLLVSGLANGVSFTAVTVITWFAVAVSPLPSFITYANVELPL